MKVVLFGYYGFRNIGDEQLLDETVRLLNESLETIQYIIPRGPYPLPFQTFSRTNFFSWFYHLFTSKALIFGGGSIFQSKTSLVSLLYYLFIVFFAKLLNCKVLLLSHGWGPFRSSLHERFARYILSSSHVVRSWRDNQAKEAFLNGNDLVFPDLTLLQERVTPIEPKTSEKTLIGLSFIDDKQLVLVSNVIKRNSYYLLKNVINQPNKSLLDPNQILLEDIWDESSSIDLIITQRYHTAIWASKYGIPWLAISDDPKLVALAENAQQMIISPKDKKIDEKIFYFLNYFSEPVRNHDLMHWYDSFRQHRHRVKGWLYEQLSSS